MVKVLDAKPVGPELSSWLCCRHFWWLLWVWKKCIVSDWKEPGFAGDTGFESRWDHMAPSSNGLGRQPLKLQMLSSNLVGVTVAMAWSPHYTPASADFIMVNFREYNYRLLHLVSNCRILPLLLQFPENCNSWRNPQKCVKWVKTRYFRRKIIMIKILFVCHGKISTELRKYWFYRVFVKMEQEFTTSLLLLKSELLASTR